MLEFHGIEVWLENPDTGQKHTPWKTQQTDSRNMVGTYRYRKRERITLHWRHLPSTAFGPYNMLLAIYATHGKLPRMKQELASVIYMPKDWVGSECRQEDLNEAFKGGLMFPYTPKHSGRDTVNRVEGTLLVDIYRDVQNVVGPGDGDRNVQLNSISLNRLGSPFARFTFNFVHTKNIPKTNSKIVEPPTVEDLEEISGSESDTSLDSGFHLPSSPDEGRPVNSRLRPANLIRPPSSPYTAELPAKRRRPSGIQVKVKDIKYHLDVQRRFHHSSASSSQASSSRDLPSVAGSSRIFLQREAQRAVIGGHPRTATQLERLSDLSREAQMEEQAQNQLIARLINGKEKRLREEKAISDALRNAVQLMES